MALGIDSFYGPRNDRETQFAIPCAQMASGMLTQKTVILDLNQTAFNLSLLIITPV
jgi:hypothetical protein